MLDPIALPDSDDVLADRTLAHLSRVVAIDSASDERSDTIPSTDGQRVLAAALVDFFAERGCSVDVDRFGSVVATLAGRGALADAPPLALLVHLDTARGTAAEPSLDVRRAWDGTRVPYRDNDALQVSVENYPDLERYLDQDLVFGSGTAPFGLDDKLGLAHMMTLVDTLARHTGVPHVPLVLVARPDEEIGRHAALVGVAEELSGRGVTFGYTLDGLEPYEINTENFNASQATVRFASRAPDAAAPIHLEVRLGGVNTHGATAREEGHRAATRFGAQLVARLRAEGVDARAVGFESDALRDCDAVACFACGSESDAAAVEAAVEAVVGPHTARGASWSVARTGAPAAADVACDAMLEWVGAFLASAPGFPLLAEESAGYDGYSHPYRARTADGAVALDIRLRDFSPEGLRAREAHVAAIAGDRPNEVRQQYVNMGPALATRPELVDWALAAGRVVGVASRIRPIRGGTGVDPLLDAGVWVANLGTGYFAPESEKEFTTRQAMAGHARWLGALVQLTGAGG